MIIWIMAVFFAITPLIVTFDCVLSIVGDISMQLYFVAPLLFVGRHLDILARSDGFFVFW